MRDFQDWTKDVPKIVSAIKKQAQHRLGKKRIIWIKTGADLDKVLDSIWGVSLYDDGLEAKISLDPNARYRFHPTFTP
jgi:hypothetical protein